MNDMGIFSRNLLTPLSDVLNPGNTSQFKLVKDPQSNAFKGLLIVKAMPVTLCDNLSNFHEPEKLWVERRFFEYDNQ